MASTFQACSGHRDSAYGSQCGAHPRQQGGPHGTDWGKKNPKQSLVITLPLVEGAPTLECTPGGEDGSSRASAESSSGSGLATPGFPWSQQGSPDGNSEDGQLRPEQTGPLQPSPIPSLAPVVYKTSRGGHNVRDVYHPFSQVTIRDLCKAHNDYGRESPYFRGLLRTDLSAAVVFPSDLRQLFSCLMNSMEFKLWEAAWKQLLRDALPSPLIDLDTVVDENGNPLTFDHLTVNPKEQGAWPSIEGEFIIIGDCKHKPQEIEVLPGTLVNNPGSLVLWLHCTHPPTYLPKGQIIAQMIPTWGPKNNRNIPTACVGQAVTEERPQVACEFRVGEEALNITGLLDMGVDVTIVPTRY
ncbi:hypothetical protein DUI87_23718 [Hirundo rustica rustica]|uniref:Peptidase A2 domain-containing protein n=1 Tax=Hirundo rustica rustica TaxID=333673 RepID=A0A3M0JXS3_HIRRU|nr:hypothetical protein DUI87_23718 [Hirundo rustica rustica]